MLWHIVDIHENGGASEYKHCAHEPHTIEEKKDREWLVHGSPAYEELRKIVLQRQFLKTHNQVTYLHRPNQMHVEMLLLKLIFGLLFSVTAGHLKIPPIQNA